MTVFLAFSSSAQADPAAQAIREGNTLYADGQYTEAINKYNDALVEQPAAIEPKFNKANGYYRLDDLGEAIDLYREVAAESKDMTLVAKAKYNLGNCLFEQGTEQRDSDLQKALESMKASITSWRGVLDIDPDNVKAAENIEVARLTIKDILDQIKKRQEQQQQDQQNQQNQQQQGQDQSQQQQDQQQQGQSQSQQQQNQDQNQQSQSQDQDSEQQQQTSQQNQDQSEDQDAEQKQQQAQATGEDQQNQDADQQQSQAREVDAQEASDATAQQILDKEKQQKQQRQMLRRQQSPPVERDW